MVSACLLGENCKYNGGNNRDEKVLAFLADKEVVAICPEKALGIPRTPMEIVDGVLINKEGVNVDGPMREAVAQILARLSGEEIHCAVLKARSPTCGVHQVYDGTFSGTLIDGAGTLAQALMAAGYAVMDNEDLSLHP